MLLKHSNGLTIIYVYDWKATPNFNKVFKAIKEIGFKEPFFYEIDTKSDDLAVVISETYGLTNDEVNNIYLSYYSEDEEDSVWEIIH